MFKLLKIAAFALLVPVLALSGSTMVAAAGQIEGGNIYRVKNMTQNGQFTDPASATCNDTVQFRVRIHNPGPGPLNNVRVSATLPAGEARSHSSTATVSASDAPDVITDTAGVNLDKAGSLNYISGTTELLDPHGSKLQNLADGITTGGVALPTAVGVSTEQMRLVQFQAKVDCPDKPEVCPEGTTGTPPNCVTPPTPENPQNPKTETPAPAGQAPATIAATGPEAMVSGVAGASALGYGVRRWLMSKAALKDALKLNQ